MNVWFCIPSARPAAEANRVLGKWRAQGYKICLYRDTEINPPIHDILLVGNYPGYSRAVNSTIARVMDHDPAAAWMVTGGDDTEPDPNRTATEIGMECSIYFGGTFGVM